MVALIREAQGEFITFKLAGDYETLVFPREEMFEITEAILEDEGIRYQFSKDLKPAWNGAESSTDSGQSFTTVNGFPSPTTPRCAVSCRLPVWPLRQAQRSGGDQ